MNNNAFSILLVDDDPDVLESYAHLMSLGNLSYKALNDPTQAMQWIASDWPGVVVLDMYMPQLHGMALLKQIKQCDARIPVIVITGHGDIPMAVDALKMGACEFLEKPINASELLSRVKRHLDVRQNQLENQLTLQKSMSKTLVGKSAQMEAVRKLMSQYALLDTHIVVHGETGSGRHTIANTVFELSGDTGDLQTVLLNKHTSEKDIEDLFGSDVTGLVLENITELSESVQRCLAQQLLAMERGAVDRTRVIAIFDKDPNEYINSELLLPELYYLLSQGMIAVPSLRVRPDDIAATFHYYLKASCKKLSKSLPAVDSHYLSLLRRHHWPGNIRELRNVAELFAIGIVKLAGTERAYNQQDKPMPLDDLVDDYEKRLIEDALFLHGGKVVDAANYLQIPRKKMYLRMKKHQLEKSAFKSV